MPEVTTTGYISVVVKGGLGVAIKSARDHGIEPQKMRLVKHALDHEGVGTTNTVLAVPARFHDKIASWFGEAGEAPFPLGTCLLYSIHDNRSIALFDGEVVA